MERDLKIFLVLCTIPMILVFINVGLNFVPYQWRTWKDETTIHWSYGNWITDLYIPEILSSLFIFVSIFIGILAVGFLYEAKRKQEATARITLKKNETGLVHIICHALGSIPEKMEHVIDNVEEETVWGRFGTPGHDGNVLEECLTNLKDGDEIVIEFKKGKSNE